MKVELPEEVGTTGESGDLVFICGALRSGTTLLRIMINHHPQLSNPGEMDFLFEPPAVKNGAADLNRYLHDLSFNRVFRKIGFIARPQLGHHGMIRDFVAQLQKPGVGLSINIHRNFELVPNFFPAARYVHLLRDPRDVARSAIGMGWAGNVYHGIDHWIASERSFERLAAMVPAGRILKMRHEDLIANPVGELTRLCRFLNVDFDPAMLSYPETTTYSAPDPALIGQWRLQLSKRDIGLVEAKAGILLGQRGYDPSGIKPVSPGRLQRLILRIDDRWHRWRLMADRQGTFLMLADLIVRRLPQSPLTDLVRRWKARKAVKFLQ